MVSGDSRFSAGVPRFCNCVTVPSQRVPRALSVSLPLAASVRSSGRSCSLPVACGLQRMIRARAVQARAQRRQFDAARAQVARVGRENQRAVRTVAQLGVAFCVAEPVAPNTTLSAL